MKTKIRTFIFLFFLLALSFKIFANESDFSDKIKQANIQQLNYEADNYRDPLMPVFPKKELKKELGEAMEPVAPGTEGIAAPALVIQGMVWGTDMPQAIIDGEIYKVGDQFLEAKILDINKEGIKLLYKDRIFIMKPEIPKQPKEFRR
ncbi:MAG: hypothetical protein FJZ11_02035 [Candidatus Omnitrophica bacterium]|nr:hypothetical protein [Candidatus Omnitrophota bacterium]